MNRLQQLTELELQLSNEIQALLESVCDDITLVERQRIVNGKLEQVCKCGRPPTNTSSPFILFCLFGLDAPFEVVCYVRVCLPRFNRIWVCVNWVVGKLAVEQLKMAIKKAHVHVRELENRSEAQHFQEQLQVHDTVCAEYDASPPPVLPLMA